MQQERTKEELSRLVNSVESLDFDPGDYLGLGPLLHADLDGDAEYGRESADDPIERFFKKSRTLRRQQYNNWSLTKKVRMRALQKKYPAYAVLRFR